MVITDHGSVQHAKIGVEKVNPDIRQARDLHKEMLVFQGLEWNIPAAEHGTVFVHPGKDEVAVLKEFENSFDGVVNNATASTAANEALAIAGINFLADAVQRKRVRDALFLANHPARKGIDSPHEIRGWRSQCSATSAYVRPMWIDGRLTLVTRPAPAGSLAPSSWGIRLPAAPTTSP